MLGIPYHHLDSIAAKGTAICRAVILAGLAITTGCQPTVPDVENRETIAPAKTDAASEEPSLVEQIATVTGGESNRIEVKARVVTDEDLELLSTIYNLEELVVGESEITDDGLAQLGSLRSLRTINLGSSKITDEGLRELVAFDQLETLRIGSSEITGQGFESIADLPNLRFLIITDAPVTDEALPYLEQMNQLESLYVERTSVTDEGIEKLREKLPQLHVHW